MRLDGSSIAATDFNIQTRRASDALVKNEMMSQLVKSNESNRDATVTGDSTGSITKKRDSKAVFPQGESLEGVGYNSEAVTIGYKETNPLPSYSFVPGEGFVRDSKGFDIVVEGGDEEDDTIDPHAVSFFGKRYLNTEVRGHGGDDHILFGPGSFSILGGDGNDLIVQKFTENPGSKYDGIEISGGNGRDSVVVNASVEDVTLENVDGAILVNGIKILADVETIWFIDGRFTFAELLEKELERGEKLDDKNLDMLAFYSSVLG